ncbi:MAG TPA: hypothetical protein VGD55_15185 [Acidothermaceae bacterium]
MARYGTSFVSQTAVLAGVNATTTVNGYLGALIGGASANPKLRRMMIGCRTASAVPIVSQQFTIGIYPQTVRAVGTGLSNVAGNKLDPNSPADPTGGVDFTTATTLGTSGPTLAANPTASPTFNTQANGDSPWENLEELYTGLGTANGLAFVNIGNTFQAGTFIVVSLEWEV